MLFGKTKLIHRIRVIRQVELNWLRDWRFVGWRFFGDWFLVWQCNWNKFRRRKSYI